MIKNAYYKALRDKPIFPVLYMPRMFLSSVKANSCPYVYVCLAFISYVLIHVTALLRSTDYR
jgi:hypothetical protein